MTVGQAVVEVVGARRSTWRRWNLHAEASRQTMGWRFATTADRETVVGLIADAAEAASVRLTPPELSAPDCFRRPDGSSRLRPRHMVLYSSQALFDAEERLLALSRSLTGPAVAAQSVARLARVPDRRGLVLGPDQAEALERIACSGRVVDVLVGPAGAGKTAALGRLRQAWQAGHGPGSVVGLAPSATAAAVLGEDLGIAAENTARWLAEHDHLGRDFQAGQLVIVDEASLAGTIALDRIAGLAARAGAKVLLVGDWAQLQAVDAGGAFTMLAGARADTPELCDVHRFRADWEKTASLALRHGREAAIDAYTARGRVAEGDLEDMVDAAYQAWRADARRGLACLLVADSRETVRELNQRARSERVIAGQVRPDGEVALAGPTRASAGDVVITRRNDRRLVAGRTGWVRNGDRWTVVKTHPGGAVTVRRAGRPRGASVTLPAAYVSEYLDLGYAVTAHRAQRVTVDACHVVVTPATTRENLYVAMTRGRDRNQAWVAVGMPDPAHTVPHPSDQPERDARGVLARVLRNSGAEPSAHQTLAAERELWGGTAQLLAEVETLTAAGDQGRWAALVAACGLDGAQADQAVASEAFGPLCAELRRAEANGIDPRTALPGLVAARPLTGADDIAAVLRHRVAAHTDQAAQTRRARPPQRYILALLPAPSDRLDPGTRHAIGQRIDALTVRAQTVLDRAAANSEPWLARLGPRPVRPQTARRWDQAALAVAAYRDRWDETGPEPLGQPQTPPQRQHAARVNTLIADIDADRAPARTAPSPRRDHGPTL